MTDVKQELLDGLVLTLQKTVAGFLYEATMIEKTLDMGSRQYDRTGSLCIVPQVDTMAGTSDQLLETIRAVVMEELRNLFQTTPQPQVAAITYVIREEVH